MKWGFVIIIIILILILLGLNFLIIPQFSGESIKDIEKSDKGTYVLVTEVTDGDTIVIQGGERVRLLGINAPEKGEEYYSEAKGYLSELILHEEIYLEKDRTERDRYDRLLRWIWLDDKLINAEIVKNGFAIAKIFDLDTRYQDFIKNSETYAIDNNLGIWKEELFEDIEEEDEEESEKEIEEEPEEEEEKIEEDEACIALGCEEGSKYVGSKNSDKYHLCDCVWATKIKPENIICFDSIEGATEQGYIPCKTCNP